MSENPEYSQKHWSLINPPEIYKFNEEEEIVDKKDYQDDDQDDQDDQSNKNNDNDTIEDIVDQFRPESKQVNDPEGRFLRSYSLELLKSMEVYKYFKSDYFYASFIDYIIGKKTQKLDFLNKTLLTSTSNDFFRLFGFQQIKFYMQDVKLNLDPIAFLNDISKKTEQLKEEESKREWEKLKLQKSDGTDIKYKPINLEECKIDSKELSVINWILGFHNYGMSHYILFTFAIFYDDKELDDEDDKSKYKCLTFSVGRNYHRNRCFVTFTHESDKEYTPSILSLFTETTKKLQNEAEPKTEAFLSISDQFFLIEDKTNDKKLKEKCNNNYEETVQTPNYEIIFSKKPNNVTLKEKKTVETEKESNVTERKKKANLPLIFKSVSKLNLFLKSRIPFQMSITYQRRFLNNFFNNPNFDSNSTDHFGFETNERLISILYGDRSTPSVELKTNEYRIFVGLIGIPYPKLISSHISLYSDLDLKNIYVDTKMDKIYCVFADINSKKSKLVEGEFGTQKVDDMTVIRQFKSLAETTEFFVDRSNNLYLNIDSKTYKQDKQDRNWYIDDEPLPPESIIQPEIPKLKRSKKRTLLLNDKRYTTPIALEINKKLFVLNKTSQLYHPAWRNCTLKHGIISTFYRLAFHVLPDYLVFEKKFKKQGDKNERDVISAIIYPQIDIGYRGNIRQIFTSSHMPGIFEYSDTAFNYQPYKDLLPHTKTDCLFFNNGELRVGLNTHRTKCQIAATCLFAFSCTIYGPGMQIRDFRFAKDNPYAINDFTLIHNFLIATYGTLLKMENESEFEYAIDAICDELNMNENKRVYYNLMEELKKNYY